MRRIETVLRVLIVLLLAGTSAAVMSHVPYFSQCDSRWRGDKLGGDGATNIRGYRSGTGEFRTNATLQEVSSSKTIYVDDGFSDNPSEHK
ncbi:MAG: hypothetical protein U9Q68_05860 [Euryarchaeota archaeon]|nr:hypothetical protein [Euryarchaeota archaeon]